MDLAGEFEESRLALFARYGFDGSAEWLVDSRGRRTAAVVGGAGDATTLLVHGSFSNAGEWVLVAPHLDGRVVAVDWPGAGLTPPVDVRRLGVRRFAVEWLDSVVDAVGGGPLRIVGSSFGAYFALIYALARPEAVDRVVLVGSVPGFVSGGPLFFRLIAAPGIGRVLLGRQPKDAEANRKEQSMFVVDPGCLPVDVLESDLLARSLPGVAKSSYDFFRAAASPVTGVRKDVLLTDGELASLTVPTRFLWGSEDNILKPAVAMARLDTVTAVSFDVLDGVGHGLPFEAPEQVAALANEFFSR